MLNNIFWTLLTICGIAFCGIVLFVMAYIAITFITGFIKGIITKIKED